MSFFAGQSPVLLFSDIFGQHLTFLADEHPVMSKMADTIDISDR